MAYPTCFVVGWNQPGYMPEVDPVQFSTFAEAVDYADGVLREWEEQEDELPEHAPEIETDGSTYWLTYYRSYVLWVTKHAEDNR